MSRILTLPDLDAVSLAAAEDFVDLAREAIARHGRFTVALAGGSTPRRLYQLLGAKPYRRQERRRWVVSHFVPKLDADRFTLTPPILNRAREIRILVTGWEKAPTLSAVLEGPRDPERLPVQLINPEAGRLIWLVDKAAASELSAAERIA